MKILYLECRMGAAGDMLMAALLELYPQREVMLEKLNSLGLPHVHFALETSVKCGITGSHVAVSIGNQEEVSEDVHYEDHHKQEHHHEQEHKREHHHHEQGHKHEQEHHHRTLVDIKHIISHLSVSEKVRQDAYEVYQLIAEAEGLVHGKPVSEIHFHEVGAMDAVADIVGVCMLMETLAPEKVLASPIHVGNGRVRCAHGILSVPAPATAELLKGIPIYGGTMEGELCTPTAAALLRHFVTEFLPMPTMSVQTIGYGMGKKDFEEANCVRAFLGEDFKVASANDEIAELCCNVDDMTGEALSFAMDKLLAEGALDVSFVPLQMKKGRPAHLLICMCKPTEADKMAILILKHTATFGVRKKICQRYILEPTFSHMETPYGNIGVKTGKGYGIFKSKLEYEDVAKAARTQNLPFEEVYRGVLKEFKKD